MMGELPIFTCQAHVFTINPQTKKSWIPSSSKAVDVNFFYDSNKHCYRIISVEDSSGSKKVIINSMLTEKMTFKKTSQKFGQWADSRTGGVHGLGFSSEADLTMFINQFKQCVDSMKNQTHPESNGFSGIRVPSDSLNLTSENLPLPTQNGQIHSPPNNNGPVNQSSTSSLTPTCLTGISYQSNLPSPSIQHVNSASLPTSITVATQSLSPITTTAQNDIFSSNQSVQNQLKLAQAQVKRLEAEINHLKRQALPVMGSSINNGSPFPTSYSNTETGISLDAADTSDIRCGINRLELDATNGSGVNNNGEWINELSICSKPKPVGTIHPSLVQGNQNRLLWMDRTSQDTIRSLHMRLGNVLKEALEIHNRLSSFLSLPSIE
ncbi:Homer protein [Schistosoma japonicum]|uniref:Homer protein n=1 Tax=Schistosoma japonicum TaxID=6182 RepID=C1L4V2_SCHJA|nr:Homer protein [Schistosoma japonicum]CAX69730.1 hypothetical protein [Schistosoma japonicum]CAX73724.1 hypothetical protein [Schistosoma japonicum]